MIDIPLENAMLCWSKEVVDGKIVGGKVAVVRQGKGASEAMDRLGLTSDLGAAYAEWVDMSTQDRLAQLRKFIAYLDQDYNIPASRTIKALDVIPEWRDKQSLFRS